MRIMLELRSGPSMGNKISLTPDQSVRFGRTSKADRSFPGDQQMSSVHFAIEHDEKGWRVRDLKSSNGTFVNRARVKEATLANGDEIRAGNTVFVFRILSDEPVTAGELGSAHSSPPSAPVVSVTPLAGTAATSAPSVVAMAPPVPGGPSKPTQLQAIPQSPQERLHALLSRQFQPLYALLDAACEPSVLKVIFESKEEYQSLFEGHHGAQLTHFAPYLIRIPPKSPLIDTLVKQAWAKNWGVYLTCDKPLKDLRTHFRQFLMVKLPSGKQVYFRFYDPTVLRLFLPTCLSKEIEEFFGPVKQFLMEADDPKMALHFVRGPKGASKNELPLTED